MGRAQAGQVPRPLQAVADAGERMTDDRQPELFPAFMAENGPNAPFSGRGLDRHGEFAIFAPDAPETPAEAAVAFMESLAIPEGPRAGQAVRLAPFQRQFITGALAPEVTAAVLSIGRGNAKTALSAGIALGAL